MESSQVSDNQWNQILDTTFCVYNYTTTDYESGTIIINKDLSKIMDEQKLFDMNNMNVTLVTLRDLLEKGFMSVGSIDLMDTMKITYPCPKYSDMFNKNVDVFNKLKPRIKGKYMHGSRKKLIIEPTGIDFELNPYDSDEKSDDEKTESEIEML